MKDSDIHEVRFTAKRACFWDPTMMRWRTFGKERAQMLIATGQAVELKEGEWF